MHEEKKKRGGHGYPAVQECECLFICEGDLILILCLSFHTALRWLICIHLRKHASNLCNFKAYAFYHDTPVTLKTHLLPSY